MSEKSFETLLQERGEKIKKNRRNVKKIAARIPKLIHRLKLQIDFMNHAKSVIRKFMKSKKKGWDRQRAREIVFNTQDVLYKYEELLRDFGGERPSMDVEPKDLRDALDKLKKTVTDNESQLEKMINKVDQEELLAWMTTKHLEYVDLTRDRSFVETAYELLEETYVGEDEDEDDDEDEDEDEDEEEGAAAKLRF